LDLRRKVNNKITFHSLYREESRNILWQPANNYSDIHANAIAQTFTDLLDREISRSLNRK